MALRVGTQDERAVREVIDENCYRLPDLFAPGDTIIDVGAQIGCFAIACVMRGANEVIAFEPDEKNYELLVENTDPNIVETHRKAVWRSDTKDKFVPMLFYPSLTAQHQVDAIGIPRFAVETPAVGLDDVLGRFREVRLLKLDCEFSEYPILFTSRLLGRCREIAGEMHLKVGRNYGKLKYPPNQFGIEECLRDNGFDVKMEYHETYPDFTGLFWGKR
jgi:FkbM family methyltransferase